MSKINQVLEDLALADLATYSIVTSSKNLTSINEGFKTMDLIKNPKRIQFLSDSLFNPEKQVAFNAIVECVKFKNIKKILQFRSFSTGLKFVSLIAYYELILPLLVYRP